MAIRTITTLWRNTMTGSKGTRLVQLLVYLPVMLTSSFLLPGAAAQNSSPRMPPPSSTTMPPGSYTWIFAVTMIFAFLDGYSIGANDVANSFATSVGSRSLKLWQAVCIAVVTEFTGAMLLGAQTTATVKDSIINTNAFAARPDLLMSGFMCALITSSIWVMFATTLSWPVSTTHSIIGAMIGIGISGFGVSAVNWGWEGKGVAQIVTSWFLSPVLAGLIATFIYTLTKYWVLKSKDSLRRGLWAIPFYFTITGMIVSFYVVVKNGRTTLKITNVDGAVVVTGDIALAVGVVVGVTVFIGLFCIVFLVPWFWRRLVREEHIPLWKVPMIWCLPTQPHDEHLEIRLKQMFTPEELTEDEKNSLGLTDTDLDGDGLEVLDFDPEDYEKRLEEEGEQDKEARMMRAKEEEKVNKNPLLRIYKHLRLLLWRSLFMDVASLQSLSSDAVVAHKAAEKYDVKTEYLYSLLQVVTAGFASFAHGSNDVGNALGPLAGVYQIWSTGTFSTSGKADVPYWMLAYAGIAIDLGLALYGYNVMRSLGNNITYHSPSRGFCMEMGSALAVITASFLALPVSTTQCIVGATVAVGLCSGDLKGINWKIVAVCFTGWILTLPVAGTSAGILYAFISRGPSFTLPPGY